MALSNFRRKIFKTKAALARHLLAGNEVHIADEVEPLCMRGKLFFDADDEGDTTSPFKIIQADEDYGRIMVGSWNVDAFYYFEELAWYEHKPFVKRLCWVADSKVGLRGKTRAFWVTTWSSESSWPFRACGDSYKFATPVTPEDLILVST